MRIGRLVFLRLLSLVPLLFIVSIVIFSISHVLPGDPSYLFLRPGAPESQLVTIRETLGLDKSLPEQYVIWLSGVLQGDLGRSHMTGNPVWADLTGRFPATFELATISLLISFAMGVPLGVIAATRRGGLFDTAMRPLSVIGVSIPTFWLGLILIFFLFYVLQIAPAPIGRIGANISPPTTITGLYTVDSVLTGNLPALGSSLAQLALPVITLVIVTIGPIIMVTRASMLTALQSDYVRTAVAYGVPERQIHFVDALRNALVSPVTLAGVLYANLIAGPGRPRGHLRLAGARTLRPRRRIS